MVCECCLPDSRANSTTRSHRTLRRSKSLVMRNQLPERRLLIAKNSLTSLAEHLQPQIRVYTGPSRFFENCDRALWIFNTKRSSSPLTCANVRLSDKAVQQIILLPALSPSPNALNPFSSPSSRPASHDRPVQPSANAIPTGIGLEPYFRSWTSVEKRMKV